MEILWKETGTGVKARLFKTGNRSMRTTGKVQVFSTSGHCSDCCTPYVLASSTDSRVTTPALAMHVIQDNERP